MTYEGRGRDGADLVNVDGCNDMLDASRGSSGVGPCLTFDVNANPGDSGERVGSGGLWVLYV